MRFGGDQPEEDLPLDMPEFVEALEGDETDKKIANWVAYGLAAFFILLVIAILTSCGAAVIVGTWKVLT